MKRERVGVRFHLAINDTPFCMSPVPDEIEDDFFRCGHDERHSAQVEAERFMVRKPNVEVAVLPGPCPMEEKYPRLRPPSTAQTDDALRRIAASRHMPPEVKLLITHLLVEQNLKTMRRAAKRKRQARQRTGRR